MSHHAYRASRQLAQGDPPFSALIMAAMRKAAREALGLAPEGAST